MSAPDVRPPSPVFPSVPDAPLPITGYVLLWFPLASETFIFHEVRRLAAMGLPVRVYTMYASRLRGCSRAIVWHFCLQISAKRVTKTLRRV